MFAFAPSSGAGPFCPGGSGTSPRCHPAGGARRKPAGNRRMKRRNAVLDIVEQRREGDDDDVQEEEDEDNPKFVIIDVGGARFQARRWGELMGWMDG